MELSPEHLACFPCFVVFKVAGCRMKSETTDGGVAISAATRLSTATNAWEGLVGDFTCDFTCVHHMTVMYEVLQVRFFRVGTDR